MLGRVVLLIGIGALAVAQDDPTDVLIRLRDRVLAHAQRIPNHTCVESVRRDQYVNASGLPAARSCDALVARRKQADFSSSLRLAITDRLRLDVLLATERELYSWAGAKKFEEGEIDELVTQGAFGTGPFASMLLTVLQGNEARFIFEGDTTVAGRHLFEFSFSVPVERSRYRVKAQKDWVSTGFTGTILAEPSSGELVRFTVRTDELPPQTGSCEDESELEYSLVRLGDEDYLLPKMTRQRFIMRDGSEGENTITFSACRDFRGESSLNFSGRPDEVKPSSEGPPPVKIPARVPITVELASPSLHSDQAAAGDQIDGRLVNPIRDPLHQMILVPAGAPILGRLMRVETDWGPPAQVTFAFRWETVEVDGTAIPISLTPYHRVQVQPASRGGLQRRGIEIQLPLPGEERYYIHQMRGEQAVLQTGSRSEWITATP